MTAYALVNSVTRRVQTFLRPDLPAGWTPPAGYELVSADALPEGWEREAAAPVFELSKLTIRRRLRALGVEDLFDSALDAIPHARADWDDAQSLLTSDPLFTTAAADLKAMLSLSDEQFSALVSP